MNNGGRSRGSILAGRARGFGMISGAALLGACTAVYQGAGPPTVELSSPFGPPTIVSRGGGPVMPPGGNLALPPSNLMPPPEKVAAIDRNGVWGGTATVMDTGGGVCLQNQEVRNFRVSGNRVRWGGFHGTIAPDNGLQMVYGTTWIYGQFVGDAFQGQLSQWGNFNNPGCTYVMELHRV